jgi:hypothetical protein
MNWCAMEGVKPLKHRFQRLPVQSSKETETSTPNSEADPDPIVREHSANALKKIDARGPQASAGSR